MSTRWFFSSALVGASAAATGGALATSVTFVRHMGGESRSDDVPGPTLSLVGAGDVLGFDPATVLREEPPPAGAPGLSISSGSTRIASFGQAAAARITRSRMRGSGAGW